MHRRFYLLGFFILFCIALHSLNTQAGVFQPEPGSIVPADSIIASIERGDSTIIDSCEIFGSLIKKGTWEEPDTIRNSLRITRTTFHDKVDFLACHFSKGVWFDSSIFLQKVSFSSSTFNGVAAFSGASFRNLALFASSTFQGDADFTAATFNEGVAFVSATFSGDVSFGSATIRKSALFWEATFGGNAMFNYSKCEWVNFVEVRFNGDAFFRKAAFEEANFAKANFAGVVDFSLKEFKDVYISWQQLKEHLWFYEPATYKLMKYFEEQRQLDDADGVYLFLKDHERMEKRWYIRYPEYWLIQQTCGYGVKPLNTLILSMMIIILFTFFYTKADAIREIEKERGHRLGRRLYRDVPKSWGKRFYYALYFSLHTFIIGVVSDWHPTDEFLFNTRKIKLFRFRTLSMIEGALGWILLVLFVVTLTRKFIR